METSIFPTKMQEVHSVSLPLSLLVILLLTFNATIVSCLGVMGRLGLSGEKPLRKVGELSGGEKARVALSMFALKASNLLLLDEPSNHLDIGW